MQGSISTFSLFIYARFCWCLLLETQKKGEKFERERKRETYWETKWPNGFACTWIFIAVHHWKFYSYLTEQWIAWPKFRVWVVWRVYSPFTASLIAFNSFCLFPPSPIDWKLSASVTLNSESFEITWAVTIRVLDEIFTCHSWNSFWVKLRSHRFTWFSLTFISLTLATHFFTTEYNSFFSACVMLDAWCLILDAWQFLWFFCLSH